jgi:glutaconate CoA-transferase subunit B
VSSAGDAAARREAMIAAILRRLEGCRVIAVGASSPLPAAASLLARAKWDARLLVLGSRRFNSFTDGGRELFDCAAQGRIDAFFLSGGQIDGAGNVNLIGTGEYPGRLEQRFPGSFGSAFLSFVVPRVVLFREEHSPRTTPERVDVVSAPGTSPPGVYRRGGPVALVTGRCVFAFDAARARFSLESVHAGETAASVREATGFAYDEPPVLGETPPLDRRDRALLRGAVAEELAETYPVFAAALAAA